MAMTRLTVTLLQVEYSGLLEMAIEQLRDPREQLRWLLRKELGVQSAADDERAEIQEAKHE